MIISGQHPWTARVLTIFPEIFPGPLAASLAGQGLAAGLWRLETMDIRGFARDKHASVDDTPFGGGCDRTLSMPRSKRQPAPCRSCR